MRAAFEATIPTTQLTLLALHDNSQLFQPHNENNNNYYNNNNNSSSGDGTGTRAWPSDRWIPPPPPPFAPDY